MLVFKRCVIVIFVLLGTFYAGITLPITTLEKCINDVFLDNLKLSIMEDVLAQEAALASLEYKEYDSGKLSQYVLRIENIHRDYVLHYFLDKNNLVLYTNDIIDYGNSRRDGTYSTGKYKYRETRIILPHFAMQKIDNETSTFNEALSVNFVTFENDIDIFRGLFENLDSTSKCNNVISR